MPSRLTYANVVSTLALFVALGGSSYAAVKLSRGDVKSKHIAKNAVTAAKVKDGSLRSSDFGAGQLPAGADGAPGVPGTPGAPGSPGADGKDGTDGEDGAHGRDGADGQLGPTGPTGPDGSPDTPSQVLSKLLQVDGPGSNLSADRFDGLDSSVFGTATIIPGFAFFADSSADTIARDVTCSWTNAGAPTTLLAEVDLPNGAQITKIEAHVADIDAAQNVELQVWEVDGTGTAFAKGGVSTSGQPGFVALTGPAFTPTAGYKVVLAVTLKTNGAGHRLCGAEVTYAL